MGCWLVDECFNIQGGSHTEATRKPHGSRTEAARKPHGSRTEAARKPHGSHAQATRRPRAGHAQATPSPLPLSEMGADQCCGPLVQAELGIPEVELHTTHGVCTCSSMAIKAAYNNIRVGDQPNALVVVSELASRLFKNTHYEAAGGAAAMNFDAEFLRWMLSDGAGSILLENQPRGQCLRIDWIRSFSHADTLSSGWAQETLVNFEIA